RAATGRRGRASWGRSLVPAVPNPSILSRSANPLDDRAVSRGFRRARRRRFREAGGSTVSTVHRGTEGIVSGNPQSEDFPAHRPTRASDSPEKETTNFTPSLKSRYFRS